MWYLASSLERFRDEVNQRWPKRSTASDGTKGDPAHAARRSDHNPDSDSEPPGVVRAWDITNEGIDVGEVIAAAIKHPSTWYVISRGYIYSRTYGFRKMKYGGSNPHNSHIHVSILAGDKAEDSRVPWFKTTSFPLPQGEVFGYRKSSKVRNGSESPENRKAVLRIQKRMGAWETGVYDMQTSLRVLRWRLWKKLGRGSTTGPVVWDAMF